MRPDPTKITDAARNVLALDVNTIAKMLEDKFPATWARMNTKNVQSPATHSSYKVVPVGFTSAIEEARRQGPLESNVGIIAGVLEKYDFPTYYVSAPLIEALKHSHPPEGLTWADLKLPFPGLCFMVPRGSLIEPEPTKGEIMCVGVARFPTGETLSIPTIGRIPPLPESRISVYWIVAPSGLVCNDTTFPETHPLEPLVEWINTKSEGHPYGGPPASFTSVIAGLVANFILVMEARKELIEPGALVYRNPRKGRPNLYSPTFIGRNYAVIRKDHIKADRKAQFTELGWRAGHFKRQHFGSKTDPQTKTIFVDPYIAFTRGLRPLETVNANP